MSQQSPFEHHPVMLDEVLELLAPIPPGISVDATVGGGGHAAAILRAHAHLRLVGIDQDAAALDAARRTLSSHGESLDRVAPRPLRPSGRLVDPPFPPSCSPRRQLPQIDVAERGFTLERWPLDMRMDLRSGMTAADVSNTYDEDALIAW